MAGRVDAAWRAGRRPARGRDTEDSLQVRPMPAMSGERSVGTDLHGEVRRSELLHAPVRPMRLAIDLSLDGSRQPGERVLEDKPDRSVVLNRLSRLLPFHPTVLRLLSISMESDSAVDEYEDIFRSDPRL